MSEQVSGVFPHGPQLIPAIWQVPEIFRHRLGRQAGKQRLMQADGHLLLVLHAPPKPDEDDRGARILWRDPSGNWMPRGKTKGDAALHELLDEYEQAIDRVDDAENAAKSARDYFNLLKELTPLTRAISHLYQVLQEARDAQPQARELINARDTAYSLARQAELLQKDCQNALDFETARQAELQAEHGQQMAVAAHRLNLLVAFFFPIATLAGIFGMNFADARQGMDELVATVGLGLLLGIALILFVVRPARRIQKD